MTGYEESISVDEIRELALRYIDENECGMSIRPKDVFVIQHRLLSLPTVFGKKKIEKWLFGGYGMLLDYTINPDEKPYGKWITMKYLSLASFPPKETEMRLQPPHIAKGYFQSFNRTSETRITPIGLPEILRSNDTSKNENGKEAEILEFPGTKKE